MSKHRKTLELIAKAREALEALRPMTVRQVYYQLVSGQVIENSRSSYQAVSNALVDARKEGVIPWDWIEDRLRRPRQVSQWNNLSDFIDTVLSAYRRDPWGYQPCLVECWLEKDALSGVFEEVLDGYGITLQVGRGFDGWSSIHEAARRYRGREVTVLYFGDFDPSGEDMVRSLRERLGECGAHPEIVKCALTFEDVGRYNLPTDFTKVADTRRAAFVEKWGDVAVELDALPADVLRERLVQAVEANIDAAAFLRVRETEQEERERLRRLFLR